MKTPLFRIVGDNVTVKKIKTKPSPETKKVLTEDKNLESTSDEALVFWTDVKKAYPALEAQLKPIFQGKDRLTVGELKQVLDKSVSEEDASFWLSHVPYNPGWGIQRELPDKPEYEQIAVQLNIGRELVNAIDANPVAQKFFAEVAKKLKNDSLHPNNSQTIAWARVYVMPDKFIIEELQSDIFGASVKTSEVPRVSKAYEILNRMGEEDKKALDKFFHEHFLDWDKKLLASVISLARKKGVKDIYMWDEKIKESVTTSQSKLDRYYKVVPRDLGFKRDTLEVEGTPYTVWHRVVASFTERVHAECGLEN